MISIEEPLRVEARREPLRLPCTCAVGQPTCAACRAWAQRHSGPVAAAIRRPRTYAGQVAQVRRRLREAEQRHQAGRVRELERQLRELGESA